MLGVPTNNMAAPTTLTTFDFRHHDRFPTGQRSESPVEAATAPINTDGIPVMMTTPDATKQMILAVEVELEERVL